MCTNRVRFIKKDLKELSKKAPQAVKKLSKLLEEIQEHPRTGTGQVEPLFSLYPLSEKAVIQLILC